MGWDFNPARMFQVIGVSEAFLRDVTAKQALEGSLGTNHSDEEQRGWEHQWTDRAKAETGGETQMSEFPTLKKDDRGLATRLLFCFSVRSLFQISCCLRSRHKPCLRFRKVSLPSTEENQNQWQPKAEEKIGREEFLCVLIKIQCCEILQD